MSPLVRRWLPAVSAALAVGVLVLLAWQRPGRRAPGVTSAASPSSPASSGSVSPPASATPPRSNDVPRLVTAEPLDPRIVRLPPAPGSVSAPSAPPPSDPNVRYAAAPPAPKVDPRAATWARQALGKGSVRKRVEAIQALGNSGGPDAFTLLQRLEREATDPDIQAAAMQAARMLQSRYAGFELPAAGAGR